MKIFKFVILTLVVIACVSCANKVAKDALASIQIIDRNGLSETISLKERLRNYDQVEFSGPQPYKSVLRVYKKDSFGKTPSILTSYHPNGQIHKYIEIKDGRCFGKYQEWHPNGNLKIDAMVIGGSADLNFQNDWLFEGICLAYNENGTILSSFSYKKGVLEGESKYFHNNGAVKTIIFYSQNEIEGPVKEFDEKENLLLKSNYVKGKKHGQTIGYFSANNISLLEDYENDCLIRGQYFYESKHRISSIKNGCGEKAILQNKKLYQLIEYRGGIPEGAVKTFTPNGELISQYTIKDVKKNGEELEYYLRKEFPSASSAIKLSIHWENNLINGSVKTWHKNGTLANQAEYLNNKKNGLSCSWYEDGAIMLIEEYDNDLLIKGSYYKKHQKDPETVVEKGDGLASIFDSNGNIIKKIKYANGKPIS